MAETVSINGVDLNIDGAWATPDLQPLLGEGPYRGANITIPGSAGVTATTPVLDTWRFQLLLYVFGDNNQAGTPYANKRQGVIDNIGYLKTNLRTGTTVTMTHTHPDAGTTSGACQVRDFQVNAHDGQRGRVARVVLDIEVVDGKLS